MVDADQAGLPNLHGNSKTQNAGMEDTWKSSVSRAVSRQGGWMEQSSSNSVATTTQSEKQRQGIQAGGEALKICPAHVRL